MAEEDSWSFRSVDSSDLDLESGAGSGSSSYSYYPNDIRVVRIQGVFGIQKALEKIKDNVALIGYGIWGLLLMLAVKTISDSF